MTSGPLEPVQSLLKRLNTKGVGYASLGSAASSSLAYLFDPGRLHELLAGAGIHVTPAQFVIAILLGSVVTAHFGMPGTVRDSVSKNAEKIGKELPNIMSASGKFIGPVLEDVIKLAEADKAGLLARLNASNVSIVDLAATGVENFLNDAKIAGPLGGVLGSLLKTEIAAAINANKAKLVTLAGTEEELAFSFLVAQAEKFVASIEA